MASSMNDSGGRDRKLDGSVRSSSRVALGFHARSSVFAVGWDLHVDLLDWTLSSVKSSFLCLLADMMEI